VTYQLYQPMTQEPRAYNEIAVRGAGLAPSALVESIRTTMAALNADLPLRQLQPAEATISRGNYQQGVLGSMLSFLAILGLGLASLGSTVSSPAPWPTAPANSASASRWEPGLRHHPPGARG